MINTSLKCQMFWKGDEMKNERIMYAAILRNDMCIVFGKDHAECITKSPPDVCKNMRGQGFLTNKYRFVLRKEAAVIAHEAGQLKRHTKNCGLLSEDIWYYNDEWDYDPERGYFKIKPQKKG